MATSKLEADVKDLLQKVQYLLEWMPICSIGSSGYLRRLAVEIAIGKVQSDFPLDHLPEGSY